MRIYKIQLELHDRIIFCTDGATQVAMGTKNHPLGLEREGLIKIILHKLMTEPNISSRELSSYIIKQIKLIAPDKQLLDDASIVSFYCREPRKSLVFTGPPFHTNQDKLFANEFKKFQGKKAIAGGTTANILSRELNIPVQAEQSLDVGQLPGTYKMEGVDLVTEGILTLTKTCEYLDGIEEPANDSAGKLMKFLLDSDSINFMVGAQFNQAHYDPNLPVEIELRKNVVRKIGKILETKYMKKVNIQFI
jgi:hypothetical protein